MASQGEVVFFNSEKRIFVIKYFKATNRRVFNGEIQGVHNKRIH